MNRKRESIKKDWYEVLNENYKFINKDLDDLKTKRKLIMNEQIKLNKVNLLNSNLDNKFKSKKDIKNQIEVNFSLPEENKLIQNRLNIKNYKIKNNITGNAEILFLKDILERIDKMNDTKKAFKYKHINRLNLNDNNITNNNNFFTSRNKKSDFGLLLNLNGKKEDKKMSFRNNNILLSKTFNHFSKERKGTSVNNSSFPKIKNRNRNLDRADDNKKRFLKMVLTEGDNSINKGKTIRESIFNFNKEFRNKKRMICGYKDKEEDYIIFNNQKIYQINLEKDMNAKFKRNFLNIQTIEDIEQKLLSESNNIFDKTRKNLVLNLFIHYFSFIKYYNVKYQLKNKDENDILEEDNKNENKD